MAEQRQLLMQVSDFVRRQDQRWEARLNAVENRLAIVERRMGDLRDDLELMFKSELIGRFAHFETTIEHQLSALSNRVAALEVQPG